MQRKVILETFHLKTLSTRLNPNSFFQTLTGDGDDPLYADVPKQRRTKSERKPYRTPMKVLIRRAKEERAARKAEPCRILEHAPENGLLVPELVEVAHRVYRARESVLFGLSKLVDVVVPVKRCRFCNEVHIGHVSHEIRSCTGPKSGFRSATHLWKRGGIKDVIYFPHCYHLHDRVGKPRIGHDERSKVERLPAIVELCVQAGLDLERYSTRRRTKPVYCMEGRIMDFEPELEASDVKKDPQLEDLPSVSQPNSEDENCLSELSGKTLESWFDMILGAKELMEKYPVHACGYCPEVQVGPKGHKVRMCRASKHQSRNGLHAWQEATIDDLIGPNHVWHVEDLDGPPLVNDLKRYYGKAPALVELCVQAGAPVPAEYRSMMRLDVVPPGRDEVDLVA